VALPAAPLRLLYDAKAGEEPSTGYAHAFSADEEASLGYALTFSADERRLFVARHAFGAKATNEWAGVPTIDVLLPRHDWPLSPKRRPPHVGKRSPLETESPEDLRTATLDLPAMGFAEPRALCRRPKEGTLLVVGEGRDTLFEFDSDALDPSSMLRR